MSGRSQRCEVPLALRSLLAPEHVASRRDFGSPKGEPKRLHGAPSLWLLSLGEQSKEPAPVAR